MSLPAETSSGWFSERLPAAGGQYRALGALLVVPGKPGTVAFGNRASSPFSIFSSLVGGDLIAILVLAMFAFMIVATPSTLWLFIKGRKAIFAD